VVIYSRNYDHWRLEKAEIAALYQGTELVVEGTISIYNELPQIEVISPNQMRCVVDDE
jgi:hypothetical protein